LLALVDLFVSLQVHEDNVKINEEVLDQATKADLRLVTRRRSIPFI